MTHIPNTLPKAPSPVYGLELFTTHIIGDGMWVNERFRGSMGGAHAAVAAVMDQSQLPENLRRPLDHWAGSGANSELGKTALVMDRPQRPPMQERLEALRRSALFFSAVGVADAVASGAWEGRTPDTVSQFFQNATSALLNGDQPTPLAHGPAQQEAVYAHARAAGEWLQLSDSQKSRLASLFNRLTNAWALRAATSATEQPSPEGLLQLAKDIGRTGMLMGAVTVLGHEGHPALPYLGEIGGLEAHKSTEATNGLHTYASALVKKYGPERGAYVARSTRRQDQLAAYRTMYREFDLTPRQRQVLKTVTFFATTEWSHP